ncbi:right-handed parallel beta-helix repeat-containing protein [Reichenbachiella agariperforans]|uniref:right-handed parallel beta-helix repeat-containing protein n=1 Tax=Reichenbachiella agariperforans TaxID=156994 RepID=UPI001C09ABFE|nr:right-handed parallel beta-helix repeat-containing protein [Reichenbachiella agariperforans]MBU2912376.1 right-handed parallel beta-helix repeat-containing protein [Reichenbachiella agariperforans]
MRGERSVKKRVLYILGVFFVSMLSCSEDEGSDTGDGDGVVEAIYVEEVVLSAEDLTTDLVREIAVTILPEDADDQSLTWSVSDTQVAEVSSQGVLTAKQNGQVIVTAVAADQGTVEGKVTLNITSVAAEMGNTINVSTQAELEAAFDAVEPGDMILLAGGTYDMSSRIRIKDSGTEEKMIIVKADPEATERPVLDYSQMSEGSSNQGILLEGDYWHFKGFDIKGAGDNGMQVKGSKNIIEFCAFYENSDTGLQLDGGASDNLILNCDSYFNADSSLENADGFAAKLTVGSGNKFVGCRAWQNLDDGWDGYLRDNDNVKTTYENCWAFKNGFLEDGTEGAGDGNGFKTGGSDGKDLKHHAVYSNCIAVGNTHDGFDHNSNRGAVIIYNAGAYDNGTNYNFSSTNSLASLTIKNSVVVGSVGSISAASKDISHNSWDTSVASADDYESLDIDWLSSERQADGSLPDVAFMKLKSTSALIDAGTDVSLPFNGTAPDLGPFEN